MYLLYSKIMYNFDRIAWFNKIVSESIRFQYLNTVLMRFLARERNRTT
nr:MAG TPA: hypothetical protein [Caudoviricetes sp.]